MGVYELRVTLTKLLLCFLQGWQRGLLSETVRMNKLNIQKDFRNHTEERREEEVHIPVSLALITDQM